MLTNTDVEATNEKIKKYQAENQQSIFINQSKKAYDENVIKEKILEDERKMQVCNANKLCLLTYAYLYLINRRRERNTF